MTDVAAALIWDEDRFLICQRPANKARGMLWEFVGGKVEHGESGEEALIRECREELGVTVSVGDVFMELVHEYPDITVRLTLFNAAITDGVPQNLEHNDIRWITVSEIDGYEFCPADKDILERLKMTDGSVSAYIRGRLFSMQDKKYRLFHAKLVPASDPERIIGVRVPELRKFAREAAKLDNIDSFLNDLPHAYYDEYNLHGFIISLIKDYDEVVRKIDRILPYVDNWATCDLIRPKALGKNTDRLITDIRRWISSDHTYTVRFGIEMLMTHFLGGDFRPEYLEWIAVIRSGEYYLNMMIAWFFATALAKQYEASIAYIEQERLDKWTHNKAIQKAVESYRITDEQKTYLKSLKIK